MIFWLFSCTRLSTSTDAGLRENDDGKCKLGFLERLWRFCRCEKSSSKSRNFKLKPSNPIEVTVEPLNARDVEKALEDNELAIKEFSCAADWEKVRVLGKGDFGTVTLIRHIKTKKLIARKVVIDAFNNEVKFTAEEVIHSQMRQNNVSRLFAWQCKGNKRFLYMEYCSRGTLGSLIKLYDLPEKKAFHYFGQLAKGVEYLHGRGVAHRDLTPGNILLTEDKVLKISDFGSSDVFLIDGKEILLTGHVGEYPYMAPEVLSSQESHYLGPPVDFWSCGIIMFNMLTAGGSPWSRAVPENEEYKMWLERDPRTNDLKRWKKVTTVSRALLNVLLNPDPLQRLSGWKNYQQH
ncbi:serine/threonine-protein kinase Chk1-like [Oratosquilla oratoria]|uniref:serine/threonine-protein kinase Chk1-like n=1 Tax=Oratosquilla oratoria TaxID=337810 RepID=UPI003F773052